MKEKAFNNEGFSYEKLAEAAKVAFAGNIDFDKPVKIDNMEINLHDLILELVATAPITSEAFQLICMCMNPYISKCQNDTIDAAKNGAKLTVLFLKKFKMFYRSGAVSSLDFLDIRLTRGAGKLALDPIKLSVRGAKDEMPAEQRCLYSARPMRLEYHKDPELGKYWVHVVEDLLTSLRNETGLYAYNLLEEVVAKPVKNENDMYITKDPILHENLKHLGSLYNELMRAQNCNRKYAKRKVIAMARNLIRNYAGIKNNRIAFKEAYRASHFENKGEIEVSGFYLAFTTETLQYFINKYCPNKKFQNKVYRFGNGYGYIGQRINFVDGVSSDGYYTETKVNGSYILTVDDNGKPIIEMPIESMIPEIKYDDNAIVVDLKVPKNKTWEELVDNISKARAIGTYKFHFAWVNEKTMKIQDDYKGASLYLCANDKPVAGVYDPKSGTSYIRQFLIHKMFSIEDIEMSTRNIKGKEETGVILIGSVIPRSNLNP